MFSLCRPPGHHAAADLYGGYCFLNNAAIAAQYLIDGGAERVAILDVDYHHGNGTQAIFYDRADVLFLSLHGDPRAGVSVLPGLGRRARQRGRAKASTSTIRCPGAPAFGLVARRWRMPAGGSPTMRRTCSWSRWAWTRSRTTRSRKFRLESADFTAYGAPHCPLGLPTLFVMEGGYAVEAIGINTVNVLQGFEGA